MNTLNVGALALLMILGASTIFEQDNKYMLVAKIVGLLILIIFIGKNLLSNRQITTPPTQEDL